jgi:PAS domain S-box-containing protein
MRAQFQDEGSIFLGTIEGLFFINTDILMNLPCPPRPLVKFNKNVRRHSAFEEDDLFQFSYLSVNPKMTGVKYTYRLRGSTDAWSNLTSRNEAYFSNLSAGEYVFEVKATYDGIEYGPVGHYTLKREVPFWKTKWFVLLLIISLVIGNILVLDKSKNFQMSRIFETKDIEVTKSIISIILIFGFIANTGAHLLASYVDETVPQMHLLNFTVGALLLALFIVSLLKSGYRRFNRFLMPVGLLLVVSHSYLGAYLSGIHPFYIIIIALTNTLTPFIFNKIRDVVLFSIFHLLCTCSILLLLEDTIYNELLFLIATLVAVCLSIFTTYIRNDALEKLIFISGVVNKGSVMTIAIDAEGIVIYTSENTTQFFPFHHEEMIGQSIADLNRYILPELVQEKNDFSVDFEDDKTYLIPMLTTAGDEVWIEWTSKVFSPSVRVIFGQDVTVRVKLESNYGLLVQSAEDLIYQSDVNGHIVFANQRSLDLLGYTEAELLSKYTVSIAADSHKEIVRKFYRTQFEDKIKTTYFEFPLKAKDGSIRWIGQNTTLLYVVGSERLISGFLCLARDITEKKAQQELIQQQHTDITASINYARRIQFNLLPNQDQLDSLFRESALLYLPKDIVSGDFYWVQRMGSCIVFVLSDCTGHGVPGSFMTLLGINLLNQVVFEEKAPDPAVILTRLDEKLGKVLPRGGEINMHDGMELTLAIFDTDTNTVQYASAGGKFITLRGEELVIHRGDSKHIGDHAEPHFQGYSTHSFSYTSADTFFFMSDGLQDQFGGDKNKKFTLKKVLELLEKTGSGSVQKALKMLENNLNSWRGKGEQTDDVTVIGFRLGESPVQPRIRQTAAEQPVPGDSNAD